MADMCMYQDQLSREQSTKHYNQIQFRANIKINNTKTNNKIIQHST